MRLLLLDINYLQYHFFYQNHAENSETFIFSVQKKSING